MPEITVKNWSNESLRTLELDSAVFDYPLKEHLIYEAVLAYQSAGRSGTHKIKNRREVSGGTRKLWRQKHTGRARVGDNRSPLWRHGGTVHGPVPRDYSWRMPKRMRRNAIRSALAQKLREGQLVCIDAFALETHKTQALQQALTSGLGISDTALLVIEQDDRNLELAAQNIQRLKVVRALGVNIVDLIRHSTMLISEPALKQLSEVLAR
jgi:large subunit ribosomal protein L4